VTLALVLGVVLAVAAAAIVALPFLREPASSDDTLQMPGELEQRVLALAEERDRALAALKELEFDHRTGKISDGDYRASLGPLRARAAAALRALDDRPAVYRGAMINDQPIAVEAPQEPAPAPGEGDPPEPARIPEPYPPPDEATPPQPAIIPEPGPAVIPEPGPAVIPEPGPQSPTPEARR
jgi:hypothetical protein